MGHQTEQNSFTDLSALLQMQLQSNLRPAGTEPSTSSISLHRFFYHKDAIECRAEGKKTINLHTCSHKCHIVHAVISDNWLQSMPPLLHRHQKRALSEWPHPAYERGQQQEVDVTIDRLRVILERPQAQSHLSANAPSMSLLLLTSINKEMQVYFCFCGFFPLRYGLLWRCCN